MTFRGSRVGLIALLAARVVAQETPPFRPAELPSVAELKQRVAAGEGPTLVQRIPNDPDHVLLTFVHRSSTARSVKLAAQLTTLRDDPALTLTRLAGTDIWYKTFAVRSDLRFSFTLAVGQPVDDQPGFVELPNAPAQPWITAKPGIPHGQIAQTSVESKILRETRTASIYTPPGYDPNRAVPYPVLICFDGPLYMEAIPVPTIFDNLIASGEIPPAIAIFIDQSPQPQRNIELSNNPPFADFVATELLPAIRAKWRVTANPAETVVCGSSAGGLAAVYFAFHRPDVFGNVLAQSAALWPGETRENPDHEWLTKQLEKSPKLAVRFVLQPGVLELVPTPLNGPPILVANRHLRDVLKAKGYDLDYTEVAGGHEPLAWRGGIAPGLVRLLGRKRAANLDAVRGMVDAFQKHPIVILGEARHGLRQTGEFLQALVRDPAFQSRAPDIVIEFASRNNQELLDRYVNGDPIPIEQVRNIWRDTTKVASWEFPMYHDWLRTIREVNQTLAPSRRLRVLAGDTAIDWSRIKTHEDWIALGDNNNSFASVILDQVLAKGRRALVVLGGNHVTKSGDRTGAPNTTTMVEARYPGSTYVVMHLLADQTDAKIPSLFDADASDGSRVDAWLYLGPRNSLVDTQPPPGSLEAEYMKEVDRRSLVEWGELRARKFLGDAAAK